MNRFKEFPKLDLSKDTKIKNAWNSNALSKNFDWKDINVELIDRRVECEGLVWLDEETKRALDEVMSKGNEDNSIHCIFGNNVLCSKQCSKCFKAEKEGLLIGSAFIKKNKFK